MYNARPYMNTVGSTSRFAAQVDALHRTPKAAPISGSSNESARERERGRKLGRVGLTLQKGRPTERRHWTAQQCQRRGENGLPTACSPGGPSTTRPPVCPAPHHHADVTPSVPARLHTAPVMQSAHQWLEPKHGVACMQALEIMQAKSRSNSCELQRHGASAGQVHALAGLSAVPHLTSMSMVIAWLMLE